MQMKVKNAVLSYDYVKRVPQMVLELSNSLVSAESEFKGIQAALERGKPVVAEIKAVKPRRSLDSNAYCWVLMNHLAEKIGLDAETIYCELIKGIGGNCDVICVPDKAVNRLQSGWKRNGIGWVTDTMPSKLEGCTNVILYYGSSTYNQAQMSRLVDRVVRECQVQGIETMTPAELARLKGEWSNG